MRLLLEKSLSVPHTVKHAASLEEQRKKKSGLELPLKDFLDNAGKVGPYVMRRHRKLWVAWAIE